VCIWFEGEVGCPAGPYSVQHHAYGDVTDDRSCTACSCGTPVGECGGEVVLMNVSCDDGSVLVDAIAAGNCWSLGGSAVRAQWVPEIDAECSAAGGNLQGDAEPTDAVTFCCMP
jgi:hypothetical protein